MKKLFFLAFFMAGFFVSIQAQTLQYVVYNGGTTTWDFKLADSNGNEMEEPNILPTQQRTGVLTGFAFDLFWKGANSNNCDFFDSAMGAVAETTVGVPCSPAASYTYKVVQISATDYVFKISLN